MHPLRARFACTRSPSLREGEEGYSYAPCAFRSMDHNEEVAPMNSRCRSGHAKGAVRSDFGCEDLADHVAVGVEDLDAIARAET